jgi:hypothetical protein
MTVEASTIFVSGLNESWPEDDDFVLEGPAAIRVIKSALLNTIGGLDADCSAVTGTEFLYLNGVTSNLQTQLNAKETGFASGTAFLFYNSSAPTGYTIVSAVDDHAVKLVSSGGGATAGTNDFSVQFAELAEGATPGVGSHQLTQAEMPAHTHGILTYRNTDSSAGRVTEKGVSTSSSVSTQSTGGDGSHSHTVDLRVKYATCIVATKD